MPRPNEYEGGEGSDPESRGDVENAHAEVFDRQPESEPHGQQVRVFTLYFTSVTGTVAC